MPEWKAEIRQRLADLALAPTREAEIVEEFAQHFDDRYEELRVSGATHEEATQAVLVELSDLKELARQLRQVERAVPREPIILETKRGKNMTSGLVQDLRYGVRLLGKNLGFTTVAILTLALGIGANTAIFSVVDAVLLKPLPYADPDRLLMVWEKPPTHARNSVSAATFLDWRSQSKSFEQMAGTVGNTFNLTGVEPPERIAGTFVSANYFDLLGAPAALGRTFRPEEEEAGKEKVIVITHRLWRNRFGADPGLIGQSLTLDGGKYTVVGVLKPNSSFDRDTAQIYAPLVLPNRTDRRSHIMTVFARLKSNVTLEQARAEMTNIAAGISNQYPDTNKNWSVTIDRLRDLVVAPGLRQTLLVLFGAVIFILLIACANLANLTLVRAASREREISIRAALGASPLHLMRQFLSESILLSLGGGALGIVLGYWLVKAFTTLRPPGTLPAEAQIALDWRVLLFTLVISILTGVVFGLVPAWRATKTDLNESLKEGKGSTVGTQSRYLSRLLVVAEMSLALALLIGSGLLIRSLLQLQQIGLGFKPDNVLTLRLSLLPNKYQAPDQILGFYRQALDRVQALPGVEQAGLVTDLPLVGWSFGIFFDIEGRPSNPNAGRPGAHMQIISPTYFQTMSIPIIKGRAFTEQDQANSPGVVIINQTLAQRNFKGEDPIGKHLVVNYSNQPQSLEIVGIAGNVRVYGLGNNVPAENAELYLPYAQKGQQSMSLAIRTASSPLQMASAIQKELRALDKDQPITDIRTMEQIISGTLADERFNVMLLGLFAVVALTLAAIGIYGIISYTVAQSTSEIGVRMALGAQRGDIFKLVLGQGMLLIGMGVVVGLGTAFALTRLMAGMLYGVSQTDLMTFALTPLVLTVVAIFACYMPARRATKVDPMVALRAQ